MPRPLHPSDTEIEELRNAAEKGGQSQRPLAAWGMTFNISHGEGAWGSPVRHTPPVAQGPSDAARFSLTLREHWSAVAVGLLHEVPRQDRPACKTRCMRGMAHVNCPEGEQLLFTVLRCLPHLPPGGSIFTQFPTYWPWGNGQCLLKAQPKPCPSSPLILRAWPK